MNAEHELKPRDAYLGKLISLQDTEPVKIITGIRRCGKSSLLKLMARHLRKQGIGDDQILFINFESHDFMNMDGEALYRYVMERAAHGKRMYLFLDELHRVRKWEEIINAFRVDLNCDIYITGSNSRMLSSEYATSLSGRCVEIKMLPLSFSEFVSFNGIRVCEEPALGSTRRIGIGENGHRYGLRELFDAYLRLGGMPGAVEMGFDLERTMVLLDGICSTVLLKDILGRENLRGKRQVSDPILLQKIAMFLADNVGSSISASSIGGTLADEGLVDRRKGVPGTHTASSYLDALVEACLFYEARRFDIKGKELLRTRGKYYIADIGLGNSLLGLRNRDRGHVLENLVYLELLRRGYDVAVGKIGSKEIDFIASGTSGRMYVQVTESMEDETVRERELAPLQMIRDNYEKVVLSLTPGLDSQYDGIKSESLVDWLIDTP
ncbi:MAG: ATP-binding protein [Succinivibrio sp.]